MNKYMQEAKEIRKAIEVFAENQTDETLIDNKAAFMSWRAGWQEIGAGVTVSSAVVNQNGTITFTMSDGSVVTITGESVIGPKGDNYNLTNQDKQDIADIVLSELPTTQGVQYGNTSN